MPARQGGWLLAGAVGLSASNEEMAGTAAGTADAIQFLQQQVHDTQREVAVDGIAEDTTAVSGIPVNTSEHKQQRTGRPGAMLL